MNPRTVLLTGANGGLGLAIARYFLEQDESCYLLLGVRSNRDAAEALQKEFATRSQLVTLDVTSEEDWERVVQEATEAGRPPSVLVNNAGHHEDTLMANMELEVWKRVLDTNLTATHLGSRAVLRGMIGERFGRIVNISSLSALLAPPGQTNYAAAKAGVVAMSQSLAKEVARMRITVNCVCPGYVETAALEGMDREQARALKSGIPMRRFGKPEEVAAAVYFLASPEAAYITGSVLKIDGGIY